MIPDSGVPLVGYRVWRVMQGGLLTGLYVNEPWPPRQPHLANCQALQTHSVASPMMLDPIPPALTASPHLVNGVFTSAPTRGCSCGFWATKAEKDIWYASGADEEGYPLAWGAVSLWGRVIEHASGWRAEYAYPYALYATAEAEAIQALYGVPVEARRERMSEQERLRSLQYIVQRNNWQTQIISLPPVVKMKRQSISDWLKGI